MERTKIMAKIPDVLEVASNAYKLMLDNKKVRVMEIRLKPGEKARMHDHPNDHVVYVMKNAKFRLTFPEGKSNEIDLKVGQTLWLTAGPHETENIGSSEAHNLVVELKQ
jgi:quercetin dioxygenase-like cupin family protein